MLKYSVTKRQKDGVWLVVGGGTERTFVTQREAWRKADKLNGEPLSKGEDWSHYVARPD